jgi:quercetin dioxygenase-like cupin family protein
MVYEALALAARLGVAAGGMPLQDENDAGSVKELAARDIGGTVGGREARATAVEVTLEAGHSGVPHRHPGPVLGYVIEGEYEWAINEQPARVLKAGETFFEPAGCLHRVSKNPRTSKVRVLAWVIHPRNAMDLAIPDVKED